jgi:hypothetical protein
LNAAVWFRLGLFVMNLAPSPILRA